MSITFTKLFSTITDSSIWCEDSDTKVVWVTMLAMSDEFGRVMSSVPGLAKRANVSVEATRAALDKFLSADPDSRSKFRNATDDGRRIEVNKTGWRLLNHSFYRELRNEEDRKEQNRLAQQRHRERKAAESVSNLSANVSKCQHSQPRSAHAEAYTDADALGIKNLGTSVPDSPIQNAEWRPEGDQLALNRLYRRRDKTPWSIKETKLLNELRKRPEWLYEVKEMAAYFSKPGEKYLRKDMGTLLNNWSGELDRSRSYNLPKSINANI